MQMSSQELWLMKQTLENHPQFLTTMYEPKKELTAKTVIRKNVVNTYLGLLMASPGKLKSLRPRGQGQQK